MLCPSTRARWRAGSALITVARASLLAVVLDIEEHIHEPTSVGSRAQSSTPSRAPPWSFSGGTSRLARLDSCAINDVLAHARRGSSRGSRLPVSAPARPRARRALTEDG